MKVLAFSGGKDSMACLHLMKDELAAAVYVDTGYTYPETQGMVEYAKSLLPVHTVRSDRHGQNKEHGIPADLVPIEWTAIGQQMGTPKPYRIQPAFSCCFENIALPALRAAKALGATHLVCGQRTSDTHRSTSSNGDIVDGVVRLYPIESWTTEEVLAYLTTKMDVPPHYALQHSSLDCYDCPAYRRETRDLLAWTFHHHATLYAHRVERLRLVHEAVQEALVV